MSPQDVPRLQIRDHSDIAELVPHLVGFQPEESLVVLVTQQGRLQVTARIDIPAVQPPGQAEELLDRLWNRFPGADAVLLAYTDHPTTGWALLRRCEDHLPPFAGRSAMLVAGDTWYTGEGESGRVERSGRLASDPALERLPVLNSRRDLDARFDSAQPTADLDAAITTAIDQLPPPRDTAALVERFATLLARNLTDPPRPDAPARTPSLVDALQLAVLAQNRTVSDVAILSMTRANAEQHLQLWRSVVNQTPAYGAEMPLYLAGMAAWITGDGATATVALERSQAAAGPGPGPNVLLDTLIDQVIPPDTWPQVRDQILRSTDPIARQAVETTARTADQPWEAVNQPTVRARHDPPGTPQRPPAPGLAL